MTRRSRPFPFEEAEIVNGDDGVVLGGEDGDRYGEAGEVGPGQRIGPEILEDVPYGV